MGRHANSLLRANSSSSKKCLTGVNNSDGGYESNLKIFLLNILNDQLSQSSSLFVFVQKDANDNFNFIFYKFFCKSNNNSLPFFHLHYIL